MESLKQSTQLWISSLMVTAALISFIMLSYVVPEFEELFEGFGAELPGFTQFIIGIHDSFYFLAAPGVIGNILIYNFKHKLGWWLVGFSGVMGVALIPLTIIAMYLPIFQMGDVVTG